MCIYVYTTRYMYVCTYVTCVCACVSDTYPSDDAIASEGLFFVVGRAIPEGQSCYILIRSAYQPDSTRFIYICVCMYLTCDLYIYIICASNL